MSIHSTDLETKVQDLKDGAQLANRLFYDYIQALKKEISTTLKAERSDWILESEYQASYPYGNYYRDFLLSLQKMLTSEMLDRDRKRLHPLFMAIYENDNGALKTTAKWIEKHAKTRDNIRRTARAQSEPLNFIDPVKTDSILYALNALMGAWFQPMLSGSIPTVRKYGSELGFKELRFGTQVEVVNGEVRINPLFEAYLAAKEYPDEPSRITNIYFNALKHGNGAIERLREGTFTKALHQLEHRHSNLAVITLPADGGLLTRRHIADNRPILSKIAAAAEIRRLALKGGMDFHISEEIKKKMGLADEKSYQEKIDELIDKSVKKLGLEKIDLISPAQRQALMFHFIKFELTSFIIESLNPDAVNFTCKDAIDRGGAHSLYFNLLKSLETGKSPLTKEEFMEGLDAAPTYVKGRAMNSHASVVWNAVDKYIKANKEKDTRLTDTGSLRWLVEWCNANRPKKERKAVKTTTEHVPIEGADSVQQYDFSGYRQRRHREVGFHFAAFLLKIFCKIISFFAVCPQMRGATTENYREPVKTTPEDIPLPLSAPQSPTAHLMTTSYHLPAPDANSPAERHVPAGPAATSPQLHS